MKIAVFALTVAVGVCCLAENAGPRLSFDSPAPGRDSGRIYYYVPEGTDLSKPSALLVFLHGGNGNTPDTAPEKYLNEETGYMMPEFKKAPFIVAAPSAPPVGEKEKWRGSRWNREGVTQYIDAVIAAASAKYKIDPDRVFLGGHSMGGFGTYHLGQVMADRFAGVWMSAGAWCRSDFRSLLGTPVYIEHGRRDCSPEPPYSMPKHARPHNWTGVSYARAADALMKSNGVEHVYDEHAEGHSLACPAAKEATKRFFEWTLNKRRNPYARKTALITPCGSLHPDTERLTKARWLELIEKTDGTIELDTIILLGPQIAEKEEDLKAQTYKIEKRLQLDSARLVAENFGGNRFKVEAENVKRFAILLSPQMGDLSKPFTVEIGGKSLTVNSEPFKDSRDYTVRLVVELP